ncbi:MAG: GNAT family N-acetyltransferase [Ornithinimicrobium sp.]|uniref:GNAT family N-acetyltransferase n=1 Tax=Ornithinimicrobium sp. TaxID=1977084 RepID=UPI003D9ABFF7
MTIRPANAEEATAALELIVRRQAEASTACSYIGTERTALLAELEDLSPPWRETLRVAIQDGEVVGAVCVDHDMETERSWIHGPWTTDASTWQRCARALVEAAIEQTPEEIGDHEVAGSPAHTGLAGLGEILGWSRSETNIAYAARSAEGWPEVSAPVRPAVPADVPAMAVLHDEAFPRASATASQMVLESDRTSVVLDDAGSGEAGPSTPGAGLLGYASGQVLADGTAYLDFVAVAAPARGQGLAAQLLAVVGRDLLGRAPEGGVSLSVKEGNAPAIALYERFGFAREAELVGYRSRPYDPD